MKNDTDLGNQGHLTDEERGPVGAWAYNTRTAVGLSVEETIHRMGRGSPSTLRKGEGRDGKIGRRMQRELFEVYRAEGERRGITVTPPPGLGREQAPASEESLIAAAIDRQTAALYELVQRQNEIIAGLAEELRAVREMVAATGLDLGREIGRLEGLVAPETLEGAQSGSEPATPAGNH